jgi:hypothetical protein
VLAKEVRKVFAEKSIGGKVDTGVFNEATKYLIEEYLS